MIGVYASAEDAEHARQRVADQPGFSDLPDGFLVSRFEVGQDHWTEGYVTVTHESLLREFGSAPDAEPGAAPDPAGTRFFVTCSHPRPPVR